MGTQDQQMTSSPRGNGGAPSQPAKKSDIKARIASGIVLGVGLALTVYGGHVFLWLMLFSFQVIIAKEIFEVQRKKSAEDQLPSFWWQQWAFFFTTAFYLYGRYIRRNLMVEVVALNSDWVLTRLIKIALKYHALMSFSAYIAIFVSFVLSLEKGKYMNQFAAYAWAHMVLLTTFIPSSLIVANLFEGGIIWFLLPSILIMINDTMAYVFGRLMGRTPLIKLSPKKTWEGFIGGAITTVFISWFLSKYFASFNWLTCPREDLTVFGPLECNKHPVYEPVTLSAEDVMGYIPVTRELMQLFGRVTPEWLSSTILGLRATVLPLQLHSVIISLFASLIAPFGGFFASGFKRAFQVKDFGDSIPGHGGMTDRMDCQIVMGVFVHVYLKTFVLMINVARVFEQFILLEAGEQVEVVKLIGAHMAGEGLIKPSLQTLIMQIAAPTQ